MAAPGDPQTPHDHDHDDLIGFTSVSSLVGAERRRAPEPEPKPVEIAASDDDELGDDLFDDIEPSTAPAVEPVFVAAPEPDPEPEPEVEQPEPADDLGPLFSAPRPTAPPEPPVAPRAAPIAANMDFEAPAAPLVATPVGSSRDAASVPPPKPDWMREGSPVASRAGPATTFGRSRKPEAPEGAMGLYAVYALILCAVPTLGVSALIALFAVTGRPVPEQPLARSHFLFQQRTLWIAAVVGVLGVVLIAVNLGVFVLVIMALWVLIRGAAGLVRLASGRPIGNPKTLLI